MKKILCFSLAIFILTISILIYCPIRAFASYPDDYYSLSKPYNQGLGLSSADAQAAVNSHKDIADSRGILCFQYTPTEKYNWTVNTKITQNIHLSDNQLKQLLMSKHAISAGFLNFMYGTVNSNAFRGFISGVGVATRTDSDTLLGIADKITGNYNYLNAIDYNEDTQTIIMSNDNASVDKLREEIKNYYYKSNGMFFIEPNTSKLGDILSSSWYSDINLYTEDFNIANNYDYILYNTRYHFLAAFNKTDFSYGYSSGYERFQDSRCYYYDFQFVDKDLNNINLPFYYNFNIFETFSEDNSISLTSDSVGIFTLGSYNRYYSGLTSYFNNTKPCVPKERIGFYGYKFCDDIDFFSLSRYQYGESSSTFLYSKDGSSLLGFSSYDKIFDYVHGDSSAYLGSAINKVGEDISFSIKDMNENLGEKMDTLIDSINDKKGSMSADELQNAIDKGLEDLNKNTEDIKDNTSDILDTLKEQNNILLQILGVTEYIAYQNDKYNNTYTKADMSNLFKKSFNRVSDAVLYGEKVDDDNENTVDRSKFSYHNGIFGHFPFSVPYQLYEWLKVFQAEPECPEFTYHYGFLIGISKDSDEYDKYKITFNLSAYDSWRKVAASFLKLSFTLTMAIGTYKKFKGEL